MTLIDTRDDVVLVDRTPAPVPPGDDEQVHWMRCPGCRELQYLKRVQRAAQVCPDCGHHMRLDAEERLSLLLDPGSFQPQDTTLTAQDVLGFHDQRAYPDRLAAARKATGSNESVVWGTGVLGGHRVVIVVGQFGFMGGSIGAATGECIARAARRSLADLTPLLLVTASGGARMQEGTLALMQLAKTSQELARLREAGVLTINVNTDPTYGGATASYASLGDVILMEPEARVGFAGPSVISQTIRQELPPGFQTAEFLHRHGLADMVVGRRELRATLTRLLTLYQDPGAGPTATGEVGPTRSGPSFTIREPAVLTARAASETVALARHIGRPTTLDYCARVFDDFVELHGDRAGEDDQALVGGIAHLAGRPVLFLGHQKGHNAAEIVTRNFGMPQPSGYAKAQRLMRQAARFNLPLITFVDSPGAYPGIAAEERGQGAAIAESILAMSRLPVPVVTCITGEGGSGGALALAVGNRVLALSNAYYSVISPEGCSTILFGDATQAPRAAEALRIAAPDLLELGIVDGVVLEDGQGAHACPDTTAAALRRAVVEELSDLRSLTPEELVRQRYERFAAFGAQSGADIGRKVQQR